ARPEVVIAKAPPAVTNTLNGGHTANYNHAISGLMLTELYGSYRPADPELFRDQIGRAIDYALNRYPQPKRTPQDTGGWRYSTTWARSDSDLSVTSWHLMFLRSARNAGFTVPS